MKSINRKKLVTLVTKFHKLFMLSGHFYDSDRMLAIKMVEVLLRWITCEGHHGLKRYKTMSNIVTRQLMGTPLEQIPLSNQYKRLIQKVLRRCDDNPHTIVKTYWVSIFNLHRLFILSPVEDITTITSGFKGSWIKIFRISNLNIIKTVSNSFFVDPDWSAKWKWHISGASGPNGQLAYRQYMNDLKSLRADSVLQLGLVILLFALPYSNKEETLETLISAYRDVSKSPVSRENNHSRLIFFGDKGGKTRVIALVDILSQSFLKTVHRRCNSILERIPQDGTFDQDYACSWIKEKSRLNESLASIDLTAATDRMPALLQAFVLWHMRVLPFFGVVGWYIVSVRRDFLVKIKGKPHYVRYKVGQPMGSLSSWPVMALTHHWIVRYSFVLASGSHKLWFVKNTPYRVLGDDLCLIGFRVAEVYIDIIHAFGMDYSIDKTYIKKGSAEFAKRLYCNGEELTPFPWAHFVFDKNNIVSNVLALLHQCKRCKIPLTSAALTGSYPVKWRKLVLLSALSPSAPKYAIDLQPRAEFWVFSQFLYVKRVEYFMRLTTLEKSIHSFSLEYLGREERWTTPFFQIAQDNSSNYPVCSLPSKDNLYTSEVLLGYGWISFCTYSWPNGLPPIGSENLIPGATWENQKDSKIFRSGLITFNKLMPGYFNTRCVGKQVSE